MNMGIRKRIYMFISRWLNHESRSKHELIHLSSFERLCHEIHPGDVILVEGRSRVSDVIKMITQSSWTHSAIYIGRLFEMEDTELRDKIVNQYDLEVGHHYIIETLLGEGTVIHSLEKYQQDHLRICRPKGLSHTDTQHVIQYTVGRLGSDYDIRQLLDLARFLFPYGILPRRWRSSLFSHNAGTSTRTVCSTMLGEAFQSVRFPILPFAEKTNDEKIHLYQRNPRLTTPKDFDFSPYFEIVKYPFFNLDDLSLYQHLPWANVDLYCNNPDECYTTDIINNTEVKTDAGNMTDISAATNKNMNKVDDSDIIKETTQSVNFLDKLSPSHSGESS
ncbi:MAG: YiiX/YebB-like N1pC/P60 family cysteine hydrolase [Gammaproteobacteria bacterium]|nr:YiiX/YebB-like N1pC/P60 family cysteine hydrolase [Gammaproteobacteria bacterium]